MAFKRLYSRLRLTFQDPAEEAEYREVRVPVIQSFFIYLFVTLVITLVTYATRFFIIKVYPQGYTYCALLGIALILLIFRRKLGNSIEYILLIYLLAMLGTIISAVHEVLPHVQPREAYYMGTAIILIERIVGYNFLQFNCQLILHVVITVARFVVYGVNEPTMIIITSVLEFMTIVLSWKSDLEERKAFHHMFRAKKDALKFKHLLTEYLPNQMLIFETQHCEPQYMNKAFKRSFRCDNISNSMNCLNKIIIENETIHKHKGFFSGLGVAINQVNEPIHLPQFFSLVTQNIALLKEHGTINIMVTEEESKLEQSDFGMNKSKNEDKTTRDTMFIGKPDEIININRNEVPIPVPQKNSPRSSGNKNRVTIDLNTARRDESKIKDANESNIEKFGSKSTLSESTMDEGSRKVYRMKLLLLMWDEVEAIAVVLDDVTKQKTINDLRIADKNKDLVIAMVSHELRTPLNGMLGLLDIAKNKLKQHDLLPYLNACRNNGILLLSLVNSILDLSQIKNKKLKLVHAKMDVKEMLNEIKSLFSYFCTLKNLYLNIEIDPSVHRTMYTDRNRLSQIIINLLGNAFKFTLAGGITIKVDTESKHPYKVKFSISDTGIGIKEEDQAKLFKLFGRLEHTDTTINTSGVGLGLTISNTLALLLNPSDNKGIQVISEVDKGSNFFFTIQDNPPENQDEDNSSDVSLGNVSSTSIEPERDQSLVRKMSVYTINGVDNFTKQINSLNNLEMKPSPSMNSKRSFNRELDPYSSLSAVSEDAVLLKIPRRKDLYLETIKDIESPIDELPKETCDNTKRSKYRNKSDDDRPWCLIVDDNPFNLMVASHVMSEKGYQIKTALNGKDAIEKAVEHEHNGDAFRVILMDCQMPVMDGYESSRVLRKMMNGKELRQCPIVALTANDRSQEHEKRAIEVGMSGTISKPLQTDELDDMLRRVDKKVNETRRRLIEL